jgi:Zn-dependent peptidase ImmA (M78 family)
MSEVAGAGNAEAVEEAEVLKPKKEKKEKKVKTVKEKLKKKKDVPTEAVPTFASALADVKAEEAKATAKAKAKAKKAAKNPKTDNPVSPTLEHSVTRVHPISAFSAHSTPPLPSTFSSPPSCKEPR